MDTLDSTPEYGDALLFSTLAQAVDQDLQQLKQHLSATIPAPAVLVPTEGTPLATLHLTARAFAEKVRQDVGENTPPGQRTFFKATSTGNFSLQQGKPPRNTSALLADFPALAGKLKSLRQLAGELGGVFEYSGVSPVAMLHYYGIVVAQDSLSAQGCIEHLSAEDLAYWIIDRQIPPLMLDDIDIRLILDTAAEFKGRTASLLQAIWGDTVEQSLPRTPFAAMVHLLESDKAQHFAHRLLQKLNWLGTSAGEATSPTVVYKLLEVSIALDLYPQATELASELNSLHSNGERRYSGKTLDETQLALEHFVSRGKQLSALQAKLAVLALRNQLPLEFRVPHLPPSLRFRRTLKWFQFKQALTIAEVIHPGWSAQLSYLQLMTLRQAELKRVNNDGDMLFLYGRQAIREWVEDRNSAYFSTLTEARIGEYVEEFREYEHRLQQAMIHLGTAPPDRFQMAHEAIKNVGAPPQFLLVEDNDFSHVVSLALKDDGDIALYTPSSYRGTLRPAYGTLIDLVAAGKLTQKKNKWTQPGENPIKLNFQDIPDDPDINNQFAAAYDPWLAQVKKSYETLVFELVDSLPYEDRLIIGAGNTALCHLVAAPSGEALYVRFNFIIKAQAVKYDERPYFYEVRPFESIIIRRNDIKSFTLVRPFHPSRPQDAVDQVSNDASIAKAYFLEQFPPYPAAEVGQRLATIMADNYLVQYPDHFRLACRGMTRFDKDRPALYVLKNYIVPLWGPIEQLQEARKFGTINDIAWASLAVAVDAVTLGIAAGKLASQGAKVLMLAWNNGFRAARTALVKLGTVTVAQQALDLFNPLDGPLALSRSAYQLSKPARAFLHNKLKALRSHWSAHTTLRRPIATWHAKGFTSTDRFLRRRLDSHRNTAIHLQGHDHYAVDSVHRFPFGPPLMSASKGQLTRRPVTDIPVRSVDGQWAFTLPRSLQQVRVKYLGDDIYLETERALYKMKTLDTGKTVWRRTPDRLPDDEFLPPLHYVPCRRKRGLDMVPCEGEIRTKVWTNAEVVNNQNALPVEWFLNRSIQPAHGEFIHNSAIWTVAGRQLKRPYGGREITYNSVVSAEILGGNDVFKQIKLGRISPEADDTRTISAILIKRKSGGDPVLVTRADNSTYYRGDLTGTGNTLSLQKMNTQHLNDTSDLDMIDEDTYLASVYNGAYDAHYQFKFVKPDILDKHTANLSKELDDNKIPATAFYQSAEFDTASSAVHLALFCKFTQLRIRKAIRQTIDGWDPITNQTAASYLTQIATTLNMLTMSNMHSVKTILNSPRMNNIGKQKNYAFLRVVYKDGRAADTYFSVSGRKSSDSFKFELSHAMADKRTAANWQFSGANATHATEGRFIDVQPSRGDRELPEDRILVPPTPSLGNTKTLEGSVNLRELDSERLLIAQFRKDTPDLNQVESLMLFTKYPTCYSCTRLIRDLHDELPGKLKVLEGPR
ncbi:hypothetical protein M2D63_013215 [Pseudomonas sp. BJa5]|uniref:hypothetical protein n=1 Tax=Pseudomonas sp. BJa5 TaxID=2936270 RepID=UPI00255A2761|nr:hypothetical protein [Pseudomonas sp. BGr12]MDL2422074.1 hypothetical protein [Pseudomonas sp. BGr12]